MNSVGYLGQDHNMLSNKQASNFSFQKRMERIDWKKLGQYSQQRLDIFFMLNIWFQPLVDFSGYCKCEKRHCSKSYFSLASVDVDAISRNVDFNALQDNIINVAFCSIESELVSEL